jgi:hypothetical protein
VAPSDHRGGYYVNYEFIGGKLLPAFYLDDRVLLRSAVPEPTNEAIDISFNSMISGIEGSFAIGVPVPIGAPPIPMGLTIEVIRYYSVLSEYAPAFR